MRRLAMGLSAALAHLAISVATVRLYSINTSPSLPMGFYRVVPGIRPVIGDVVLVCLPDPIADFARARGYLTRGRCASGVEPLGKRIAAVEGDTVAVSATGVVINGRAVPHTTPLHADSRGRPLPQLAGARWVLRPGELWLVANYNRRSFDSRYFGPVSVGAVIAVVRPVWTCLSRVPRDAMPAMSSESNPCRALY
jgi:conjugative transfer signal peptidase TraF